MAGPQHVLSVGQQLLEQGQRPHRVPRLSGPIRQVVTGCKRRLILGSQRIGDHRSPLPPPPQVLAGHVTDPSSQPLRDLGRPTRAMSMKRSYSNAYTDVAESKKPPKLSSKA